jgi:hypothetical protein
VSSFSSYTRYGSAPQASPFPRGWQAQVGVRLREPISRSVMDLRHRLANTTPSRANDPALRRFLPRPPRDRGIEAVADRSLGPPVPGPDRSVDTKPCRNSRGASFWGQA